MLQLSSLEKSVQDIIQKLRLEKNLKIKLMQLGIYKDKAVFFIKKIGSNFVLISVNNNKIIIPLNIASCVSVLIA